MCIRDRVGRVPILGKHPPKARNNRPLLRLPLRPKANQQERPPPGEGRQQDRRVLPGRRYRSRTAIPRLESWAACWEATIPLWEELWNRWEATELF